MRVVLVVTVNGRSEPIIDGVATDIEAQPMDGGNAQAHDQGQGPDRADGRAGNARPCRFRRCRRPRACWLILAKYTAFGVIPQVIPAVVDDPPLPTEQIPQQQGHRLPVRPVTRARRRATCSTSSPGPTPGVSRAYWGPEIRVGVPQPALTTGMDALTQRRAAVVPLRPRGQEHPDRLLP